jgi:hypothetical protein
MTLFSLSDFFARRSSSMISFTLLAVDRTAPVQYVQPRERIRLTIRMGISPGATGGSCSGEINELPRTSKGRSRAKYSGTTGIFSALMYSQTSSSVQFDKGKTRMLSPLLIRPL